MEAIELRLRRRRSHLTHVHLDQCAVDLVRLDETIQLNEAELVEAYFTITGPALVKASLEEVAEQWVVRRRVHALPVTSLPCGRLLAICMPQQLLHLMIITLDGAKQ